MNPDQLNILQHSLGVDQYGQGDQYRNHFITGFESTDWKSCMALTTEGLMTRRTWPVSNGDYCFIVTDAGKTAMVANSPKPPVQTRAEKRYQSWLDADCGKSFGEYLKGER